MAVELRRGGPESPVEFSLLSGYSDADNGQFVSWCLLCSHLPGLQAVANAEAFVVCLFVLLVPFLSLVYGSRLPDIKSTPQARDTNSIGPGSSSSSSPLIKQPHCCLTISI